jgi:hypothetical protein
MICEMYWLYRQRDKGLNGMLFVVRPAYLLFNVVAAAVYVLHPERVAHVCQLALTDMAEVKPCILRPNIKQSGLIC